MHYTGMCLSRRRKTANNLRVAGSPAEIGTEPLSNTNLWLYRYDIALVGAVILGGGRKLSTNVEWESVA
jgi:hypothetical protein